VVAVASVVAAGLTGVSAVAAAPQKTDTIVVLVAGADTDAVVAQHQQRYGFTARHRYRHALEGYSAQLTTDQRRRIAREPTVRFLMDVERVPNEPTPVAPGPGTSPPQFVTTGVRRVGADVSSTASGDGTGAVPINVAVLDTGIQPDHPDLDVGGGVSCLAGPADDWADRDGHGTLVAGLIGAIDNAVGAVGVAPGARMFAVRVATASFISNEDLLCGIDWVVGTRHDGDVGNDIVIANMSLGGRVNSSDGDDDCGLSTQDGVHLAVCAMVDAGIVPVVSAGNEHTSTRDVTPATYPEVLTAAAIGDSDGTPGGAGPRASCLRQQRDDEPAIFSNFATDPADLDHIVAAPGVCVSSTFIGGQYATGSGTSFSAPIVSGVVALCIHSGSCPEDAPAEVIDRIVADARQHNEATPGYGFAGDPLRSPDVRRYYGYLVFAGHY
jgi:subtilisin family serine protease